MGFPFFHHRVQLEGVSDLNTMDKFICDEEKKGLRLLLAPPLKAGRGTNDRSSIRTIEAEDRGNVLHRIPTIEAEDRGNVPHRIPTIEAVPSDLEEQEKKEEGRMIEGEYGPLKQEEGML